jgi:Na+/melibiose symporter-like transporter
MTDQIQEPPPDDQASPTTPPAVILDVWGYRIAVAGVGTALVAFLIGAAIIAAGGNPVPTQYWSVGSGLAGGLLGILAPSPTKAVITTKAKQDKPFISRLAAFASDIWNNRAVVLLLALFIVSVIFAAKNNSPELATLAAAAGGALVGLLGPSPTSKQGG